MSGDDRAAERPRHWLEPMRLRHEASLSTGRSFAHVMNIGRVSARSDVIGDARLRPATDAEVEDIREVVAFHCAPASHAVIAWENEIVHVPAAGGTQIRFDPLPRDRYRYVVLDTAGGNVLAHHLARASWLARCPAFDLGAGVHHEPLFGASAGCATRFVRELRWEHGFDLPDIDDSGLDDLRDSVAKLDAHDEGLVRVSPHLDDLATLREVPRRSRLRLLGYFSILEAVLVHPPEVSDRHETITKQVKRKMKLLTPRLFRPIEYGPLTAMVAADLHQFWGLLYDLRSRLVHGGTPDFQGRHSPLVSLDVAENVMEDAARSLLRQAIEEPRLLADLRAC